MQSFFGKAQNLFFKVSLLWLRPSSVCGMIKRKTFPLNTYEPTIEKFVHGWKKSQSIFFLPSRIFFFAKMVFLSSEVFSLDDLLPHSLKWKANQSGVMAAILGYFQWLVGGLLRGFWVAFFKVILAPEVSEVTEQRWSSISHSVLLTSCSKKFPPRGLNSCGKVTQKLAQNCTVAPWFSANYRTSADSFFLIRVNMLLLRPFIARLLFSSPRYSHFEKKETSYTDNKWNGYMRCTVVCLEKTYLHCKKSFLPFR